MKPQLPEESVHALVDGELTPAEAEAVLTRLRDDAALRSLACDLRLSKDLVRHAYAQAAPGPQARAFAGGRRWAGAAAVAAFATGALLGWLARDGGFGPDAQLRHLAEPDATAAARASERIVLHIGSAAPEKARAVLDRAEGILDAARASGRPVAVEIVANGGGLDLLREDVSAYTERIASLRAQYPALALIACGQTAQRLREGGTDVQLVPGTIVATSALDEIVRRLQEGWAYVLI